MVWNCAMTALQQDNMLRLRALPAFHSITRPALAWLDIVKSINQAPPGASH